MIRQKASRATGLQLAQREPPQRHGHGLAAGVARLPGQHGEEDGQHRHPRDGALEEPDHRGREKGGHQVELQPRVAEAQTGRERRAGALLFLDAARHAENAWLARERDPALRGATPREVALAYFDLADGCLMSAKKDGLVNIGGFLALRDRALAERIRSAMVSVSPQRLSGTVPGH